MATKPNESCKLQGHKEGALGSRVLRLAISSASTLRKQGGVVLIPDKTEPVTNSRIVATPAVTVMPDPVEKH